MRAAFAPGNAATTPNVNVKATRESSAPGASDTVPERKKALPKAVTHLLHEIVGRPPRLAFVLLEEVELENVSVGSIITLEHRQQLTRSKHQAE
ncbi:tautomerase family protein [Dyella sp.]|uniref:tautomerase family protein n=1 Tax=Dyella sp. TaxID=1869338 RepID=UPI0039C854B9